MFYLLVVINIGLPALGLWSLENGGMAPMLDFPYGYPNGATYAYLIHVLYFTAGGFMGLSATLDKRAKGGSDKPTRVRDQRAQKIYVLATAAIFCGIALLALGTGGLRILTGSINKLDLRVLRDSQGLIGTFLTVALKWYMPCSFAVFAVLGREKPHDQSEKILIMVATVALIVTGLSTGFKTTVLFVFQPYLVLRFWRLSLFRSVVLVTGAFAVIFGLSMAFDGSKDLDETLFNLKERVTNYQGDLAWGIWEKATMGEPMPPYARTYLSIPGSRFLEHVLGVSQGKNSAEFASYYFGPTATLFGGYPIEGVEQGVNNQATLFGEAVIALGPKWYTFFSFGSGILFGVFTRLLRRFVRQRDPLLGPVWATFLCTSGLMWLMGNGAASMLYLINIAGLLATGGYIFLFFGSRCKGRT